MRLILIICFLLCCTLSAFAFDTRGLRVVAKDSTTNQTGEVKLYNKSYAVIIGIDRYQNLPPDRQLKNAVNDAKGVEAVIRKNYRFDKIITLHNEQATREKILELLTEELPAQMGKEDSLFLFWAGHGNQEKSDYGDMGYLIPYDGSVDKIRKNLTMAELRDTISKKLPAKHIFYVMDACYSGLLTTRSVDSKTRRDLAYLKEITKESVRQVLTAGGKNEEALDGGPKGHSVFTGRFIELLENAQDFITANELQASIKEKVYSDAKARNHTQTPSFGPLYGLGDYVFVPIQQDRLGNLAGESAARQKELEQYRKMEQEAAIAKQREQQEIVKKQAELDALDKQIAEMKGRPASRAERDRLIYTDPQTGLMWTRNGNIEGRQMKWDEAMTWAGNLNYAGYNDWRLPTIYELKAFAKRGGDRPSEWFNANGFNNTPSSFYPSVYWSSTYYNSLPNFVNGVIFSNGGVCDWYKLSYGYVWPVRGGQ